MQKQKRETVIALKATHTAYRVANDVANPTTPELEVAIQEVQEASLRRQEETRQAGLRAREAARQRAEQRTLLEWRTEIGRMARRRKDDPLTTQQRALVVGVLLIALTLITAILYWLIHAPLPR